MRKFFAVVVLLLSTLGCSTAVQAEQLEVSIELPSFDTANYHKPYVAIWLESKEKNESLLLWHMHKSKIDKWLKDIRRWWRKQGRYGDLPDGITGATKGPGQYQQSFEITDVSKFKLYIEVVREDGARSLLKQKIELNGKPQQFNLKADKEIGPVVIKIK